MENGRLHADALYRRARVAIRERQLDEARRLLTEAVRADPRHENAWLALASALTDINQAIDCLKRVLVINPNNKTAQEWLKLALRERARQEAVAEVKSEAHFADIPIDPPGDEDRPVPRLGKYLLEYRFITTQQLKAALQIQQLEAKAGTIRRLGDILIEQGALTRERLDFALREQNRNFFSLIDE
ncbi:MAG: tetratricopeptide repeat protein [Anaerolineales bacterium]|nr:tetratricopeptide repeat protein [Anaerolineales bacterium]